MHPKRKTQQNNSLISNLPKFALLLATTYLASCASGPVATVEDRSVRIENTNTTYQENDIEEDSGDTATPYIDRRYQLEQAEYYQQQANRQAENQQDARSIDNILSSAEFYIQANDIEEALASVRHLGNVDLDRLQWARYRIVLAYVDYSQLQYQASLDKLSEVLALQDATSSDLKQQIVDTLLLSSFCYQKLNDHEPAISVLLNREALLYGAARTETSRYIWQVIDAIPLEERELILQNSRDFAVRNRIEQSMQGQVSSNQGSVPRQFDQWRDNDQPAQVNEAIESTWDANSPRTISILLPLSSRFAKAAQAVLEGIQYQHSLNTSDFRPRLQVYDIGADPLAAQQFYLAAVQQGSDAVIGPLGKEYANHLVRYGASQSSPNTVLLGGDLPLSQGMYRLTLSPERQGQMVADRAMARGFINAAILSPDTNSGKRTAQAFSDAWLSNGGKLSKSILYSPKQFDHTVELKQMFDINQSKYRHNALSNTLGFKPKFAPYRRNDIDFIFMISDIKSGRIVRPQIDFFSGTKIPVIATSAIYNGIEDQANNMDLDQTEFPVMPWVLRSKDVSAYAGQLNRLFAMGTDAYSLTADLQALGGDPSLSINGNMGRLNIQQDGEIRYQPAWAKFNQGLIDTDISTTPLSQGAMQRMRILSERARSGQTGGQRYNESNWDSRQSRRKDGS